MALSDIAIKKASDSAIFGLQRHIGAFSLFAKNFSPAQGEKYSGVAIPVYSLTSAADFAEGTNDWGTGADDVDGAVVNLSKHFIKTIALPDTGIATTDGVGNGETELNFIADGSRAIGDVLGTAASKYVFGMFTSTNVTAEATMPDDKAGFAGLLKVCDDNGVDPFDCVLVLDPEHYGSLLACLDANVYGGEEAIRNGYVPNVYGFKGVVMTGYLPEGVLGVIVPRASFGVVSRVNTPAINGYSNTWTVEDANGLSIGMRVYEDLSKGKAMLGGDLLIGAKVLADKAIRLVAEDEDGEG